MRIPWPPLAAVWVQDEEEVLSLAKMKLSTKQFPRNKTAVEKRTCFRDIDREKMPVASTGKLITKN